MYSRAQLAGDFRRLGVAPGDTVMIHASVRAVGEIAGGPDEIHLALKEVVTEEGTLLMYAGCPRHVDEIGRGNLTAAQEAELLGKLPAFDPWTARSARDHGTLVEFLRTWPGTRVNDHVARFACWGRHADRLVAPHPWNYPYGADSPLERFLNLDGRILLLGCDHDTVTFLHYAEQVVDIPDKRVARFQVPVNENGRRVWRTQEEFDTAEGVHANWPDRFFARLTDGYLASTGNAGGRVGDARAWLLPARGLLEYTLPLMRAVAGNPEAATGLPELSPPDPA